MRTYPHDIEDPTGDGDDDAPGRPSKTRLKKDMQDLQDLGEALLELPAARLAPLNLPEVLLDALAEMQRTRSHEGRRRQRQYLGKLMRGVDPEPVREAIAAWRLPSARETLALHEAERWRARLVADDTALTEWLDAHPGDDAQALRALIRSARKDAAAAAALAPGVVHRKGRAWRDLFQIVRAGLAGDEAGDEAADDATDEGGDD